MQKPDKIDFTKLLGFATVADELLSETTDFREATLGEGWWEGGRT